MPHFIFIQQIPVLNILNMLYNHNFFSSKCRLFHNATLFGFCITHILNTECAKIWKKKSVAKRLIYKVWGSESVVDEDSNLLGLHTTEDGSNTVLQTFLTLYHSKGLNIPEELHLLPWLHLLIFPGYIMTVPLPTTRPFPYTFLHAHNAQPSTRVGILILATPR